MEKWATNKTNYAKTKKKQVKQFNSIREFETPLSAQALQATKLKTIELLLT